MAGNEIAWGNVSQQAKPFLKWAGGKGKLLRQLEQHFPKELTEGRVKNYVEPFLGSGAVFFELMQKFELRSASLSDINKDLILAYQVVQQKHEALLDVLAKLQKSYNATPPDRQKARFLSIRNQYNRERYRADHRQLSTDSVLRAAQLIFLNKTCFNGLYRLNSNGAFNVPFGGHRRAKLFDEPNIVAVAKLLQRAEIKVADYQKCFKHISDYSFVYFDPPYRPLNKTANFTAYVGKTFGDKEQITLAQFCRKLHTEFSVKFMLSNSDPTNENPDDLFFERIFEGFKIRRLAASRAINSNPAKRGVIREILVTNY